jgi:hypothetical protein
VEKLLEKDLIRRHAHVLEELPFQQFMLKCNASRTGVLNGNVLYGANTRKKYNIFVIRITSENKLVNSRPCAMCIKTMRDYGVKKVYYSNDDGSVTCEKTNIMQQTMLSSGMRASINNMDNHDVCKMIGCNMYNDIKHNKQYS